MISWTTNEVIHRIVKRDVPESDRGTIPTLNDLPDWMVEEARQASPMWDSFASWPTTLPTAPDAADTTTVSPGFGWPSSFSPK